MRERVFNARTSTFSGDEMKQRTAKRRNSAWSNRFVQRAKQPMAISEDRVAYRPRISFVGQIAYACLPLRQDVVLSNMRRAFSDRLCEAEIRDLAQAFYSHFTLSLWEFFTIALRTPAAHAKMVRIEHPEIFFNVLEARRGLILLGGHTGNWSVALTALILHYPELCGRISVLVRPFRPAWLQRLFWRRFQEAGINILEKRRSMKAILQRLAANQAVGFVMDQHASPQEAVQVDFFGRPAWTFRSLAVIARRSGAAIVPVGNPPRRTTARHSIGRCD